jgi:hypothetical protein
LHQLVAILSLKGNPVTCLPTGRKTGTVPAAVSHFESIVIHATVPDLSGVGRQQLFDESEDLPAKILDERTSGVRFRESPQ